MLVSAHAELEDRVIDGEELDEAGEDAGLDDLRNRLVILGGEEPADRLVSKGAQETRHTRIMTSRKSGLPRTGQGRVRAG
jgi:hypothetical protein